jgi:endonuclease/exonuclease/phosphatase family metal-dependent hydrolase
LGTRGSLRLVTYNVHGCVGRDGELSPERIADALAPFDPDVVALQELDVARMRSRREDQPRLIARRLRMEAHFAPAFVVEDEAYGNAILSRHPMRVVRAGSLPGFRRREPRGALCVEIDAGGQPLHVVTTHLGLGSRERLAQVDALLGKEWLDGEHLGRPVVVCGDLNATPISRVYRRLSFFLRDVQRHAQRTPRPTFPSFLPVLRIDHIFVSDGVAVSTVEVLRTPTTQVASDHLPLMATLEIS